MKTIFLLLALNLLAVGYDRTPKICLQRHMITNKYKKIKI